MGYEYCDDCGDHWCKGNCTEESKEPKSNIDIRYTCEDCKSYHCRCHRPKSNIDPYHMINEKIKKEKELKKRIEELKEENRELYKRMNDALLENGAIKYTLVALFDRMPNLKPMFKMFFKEKE